MEEMNSANERETCTLLLRVTAREIHRFRFNRPMSASPKKARRSFCRSYRVSAHQQGLGVRMNFTFWGASIGKSTLDRGTFWKVADLLFLHSILVTIRGYVRF